jgi:mannose-6-phosphate isomerase-like protein (cupin superfamily)
VRHHGPIWNWSVTELLAAPAELQQRYAEVLRVATLSAGVYGLDAGAHDPQEPHTEDEVYVVLRGQARATVGGETVAVAPGSLLYVPARVPHRFHDIKKDLAVLVLFALAEGSAAERDWYAVVAEERCDDCGLAAAAVPQHELGTAISREGARWGALLSERAEHELRRRPRADVWSALEYAAHVRDVLALFRDRVGSAITEEEPEFGWWDHEAAAVEEGYNEQDPPVVAAMLQEAAERLVMALPAERDAAWQRAGTRRERERFTVDGLARFALHEARHHRFDAERGLA